MALLTAFFLITLQVPTAVVVPVEPSARSVIEAEIQAATQARESGRLDDAFAAADRAIASARALNPGDPVLLSDALVVRCDAAAGRSEPDISDCLAALDLREAHLTSDDPKLHNLRLQIAVHSVMAGRAAEAQGVIEPAIAGLRRAPQTPALRTDVGMGIAVLGMAQQAQDRRAEAEASYRSAIAELGAADATGRGYRPMVYNYLNALLLNEGRLVEALADSETALALQRESSEPNDPTLIGVLNALAAAQQRAGRYAEAEASLREQLALIDAEQSPQPSLRANALSGLASLYVDTGRAELARPLLEQAVALYHEGGPTGRRTATAALGKLADLDLAQNNPQGAIAYTETAIADLDDAVSGSQGRAALLVQLATALEAADEIDRARVAAADALVLFDRIAPRAPAASGALLILARLDEAEGRATEARERLDRAVTLAKARPLAAPTRITVGNARIGLALSTPGPLSSELEALARETSDGAKDLLVSSARSGQTVGGIRPMARTALLNRIEVEWRSAHSAAVPSGNDTR